MLLTILKKILSHELIGGAGIIFISSFFASIFNFLFNLFMSRNLSVSDYGILASLISLITLSSLPASTAIPTIINFAASYFAKGDLLMVRGLFFKIVKVSFFLGVSIFILFFLFAKNIGQFFNINNESLIILAGLNVILGFIVTVNSPLLQAKLAFKFLSFANILSASLKLFLGVVFVFMGFAVGGALWALLFASFIPYLLSFIPLKFLLARGVHAPRVSIGKLLSYGTPAALASFGLMSFITMDIILVKHFFEPDSAGIYAGVSLIGRVIFFFSAPVVTVMFPLITQKHTREESYHHIFRLSMLIVFLSSILITIFYFTFPEFTIRFFTREAYVQGASYLGLFGIFITLYSLLYVVTNFYLSIKKTEIFVPILIGVIGQSTIIWFFHENFFQVIIVSLLTTGLLLTVLLLYYLKLYGKKAK